MIGIRVAKVIEILMVEDGISKLLIDLEGKQFNAVNFNKLTGYVKEGDSLLVNTTAIDLNLGSGGYHFVISNLNNISQEVSAQGHIMKLRYSPYQLKVFAAEEQASIYHDVFNDFETLNKMPVIIGTLHSMLLPISKTIHSMNRYAKIGYIMTDGAALPIDFSDTVRSLKSKGIIQGTVTIGHAFGGDLDCVNIYNGLIAVKEILQCDVIIVTIGPGILGTGTKYGFTGIEQGHIIDAVNDLGGFPIAVPRISFADNRSRHQGISHHSLTVLSEISKTKATIGIPLFEESKNQFIVEQIKSKLIDKKHSMIYFDSEKTYQVFEILENSPEKMSIMGRRFNEDKEFFITAGVAAHIALDCLNDHQ